MVDPLTVVDDPKTQQALDQLSRRLPSGNIFLRLVEAGVIKINFGTVTVEFPGESVASTGKKVGHNLGVVPKAFLLGGNGFGGIYGESTGLGTSTETEVRAVATAGTPVEGTKATLSWVAIG